MAQPPRLRTTSLPVSPVLRFFSRHRHRSKNSAGNLFPNRCNSTNIPQNKQHITTTLRSRPGVGLNRRPAKLLGNKSPGGYCLFISPSRRTPRRLLLRHGISRSRRPVHRPSCPGRGISGDPAIFRGLRTTAGRIGFREANGDYPGGRNDVNAYKTAAYKNSKKVLRLRRPQPKTRAQKGTMSPNPSLQERKNSTARRCGGAGRRRRRYRRRASGGGGR